jgi:ABC-type phosphate transport system permease subunit
MNTSMCMVRIVIMIMITTTITTIMDKIRTDMPRRQSPGAWEMGVLNGALSTGRFYIR